VYMYSGLELVTVVTDNDTLKWTVYIALHFIK